MSDFFVPSKGEIVRPKHGALEFEQLGISNGLSLKNIYVIYNKEKNQCLHDPMTGKPVNNRNRNLLTEAAKTFGGEIMTAHDAFLKIQAKTPFK
jgi:hypothetical protein